jgi:hypothetical protein
MPWNPRNALVLLGYITEFTRLILPEAGTYGAMLRKNPFLLREICGMSVIWI